MTRLPTCSTTPIASLLNSTQASSVSFLYASHSRWPLPPHPSAPQQQRSPRRVGITVLDSSFNPPHAAHVALAESAASLRSGGGGGGDSSVARLLAFTVTNVDKDLDPRDLHHRLELIRALAVDLEANAAWDNVAVAVLDAATFVKKAEVLNAEIGALLRERDELAGGAAEPEAEFVFPVGWDTIVRIFAPRYYPPPGPDLASSMRHFLESNRSALVCARRGTRTAQQVEDEAAFASTPEVAKWLERGKLTIVDLDESVREISSTRVREAVRAGEWDKVHEMVPFPSVVDVIKKERLYL